MYALTVAEIDTELASRGREIDAVTATLLELDKHPGLTLLRGFPPAGTTARRWTPVRQQLDLMWEDFGRVQTILEEARAIRARRHRPTDTERAELTRLLRERPHEVSRTPIPLAQRTLTGPGEQVLFVGIADTLDRMRHTFPAIAEFLDSVDAVNTRVLTGLAPVQAELDRCGGVTAELTDIAAAVAELLARSGTDPLSLRPAEVDERITALAERTRREAAGLAELRAMTADWPAALAETRARIEALRTAAAQAARICAEAEERILTAALPRHPDPTVTPTADLNALAAGPATAVTAAGLLELRRRVEAATRAVAAAEQLAQGLLDRHSELHGRLTAYQAKAARLGFGEDRDVLSTHRIATGLLARRPCDLAAVTRAVADYQQIIAEKSGRQG
ncbi:hypothetical protein [Nocardia sp. alder85J]|uniref:hypothetical protein n=1 Tax=Nocardia sp. alder85J TaxID=2862949 RepID=UPI001CD6ED85|nr:hypothetical protein [Nocardia sp. alder85J]MCX4093269.1 hypothetical protein [Nocardia sp. alder85J]